MRVIYTTILALSVLLALSVEGAQPVKMTLLAVQEVNNTFIGSTADLFLETRTGRGRVFLETFPFTKMDTQISTRFAKEVACNYFDLKCTSTDFIYTIQSHSSIIGGPSAGAALAALTTAAILNLPIDDTVAVTGTINSGGLVGPVSGIGAKMDAAQRIGIKKMLIPHGTLAQNKTANISGDAKEKNISIVEVSDLNEVLFHFTGRTLLAANGNITADPIYLTTMEDISNDLCDRGNQIREQLKRYEINNTEQDDIHNTTSKIEEAQQAGLYYAAASYCFGLNVKLRTLLYEKMNISKSKIMAKTQQVQRDIENMNRETRNRSLHTITDIQTMSIVSERLLSSEKLLERVAKEENKNEEDRKHVVAFAEERLVSAKVWSRFFNIPGRDYNLDRSILQRSCIEKLQEARERIQYLTLFLREGIENLEEEVEQADTSALSEKFELCLVQASEAKARANAILSTAGIGEQELERLVQHKLEALEKLMARTIKKQAFPLLGYSYYEYARSLKPYDPSSALLYAEYALELSNLDMYFQEEVGEELPESPEQPWPIGPFLIGLGAGIALAVIAMRVSTACDSNPPRSSKLDPGGKKR